MNKAPSSIATAIHYPDCWDTAAYPTLESALHELATSFHCTNGDCTRVPDPFGQIAKHRRDIEDDDAYLQYQRDRIAAAQKHDAKQAKPKLTPGVQAGVPLSDEQIDAIAKQTFCKGAEDKEGAWGPGTVNATWLELIGRPIARAVEAAHGIGVGGTDGR